MARIPEEQNKPQVTYVEVEVNLQLLNTKLNEVLRRLDLIAEKAKVDLNQE